MSKINPEPNLIHIMGCYVLGNPNGEKVRPFPFLSFLPSFLPRIPRQPILEVLRGSWVWFCWA